MRLVSYNIYEGGAAGIAKILHVLKTIDPEFLAIQEANTFTRNNNALLKRFSKELCLPFYDIALAGQYDYHVVSFSKYPIRQSTKLAGFRNACLQTVITAEFGEVSICNAHLSPKTEEDRLKELEIVLEQQSKFANRIIVGDLNSLSEYDSYPNDIIEKMNDSQKRKFVKNGALQFGITTTLRSKNYKDVAYEQKQDQRKTVPTKTNTDAAHMLPLRIDYIFVSQTLVARIQDYNTAMSEYPDFASDHYPVIATLG